jgi:hypothetical protein
MDVRLIAADSPESFSNERRRRFLIRQILGAISHSRRPPLSPTSKAPAIESGERLANAVGAKATPSYRLKLSPSRND